MANEFGIKVSVQIDTSNIQSQLNAVEGKLPVKIDTQQLKRDINTAVSGIGVLKQKISLDVNRGELKANLHRAIQDSVNANPAKIVVDVNKNSIRSIVSQIRKELEAAKFQVSLTTAKADGTLTANTSDLQKAAQAQADAIKTAAKAQDELNSKVADGSEKANKQVQGFLSMEEAVAQATKQSSELVNKLGQVEAAAKATVESLTGGGGKMVATGIKFDEVSQAYQVLVKYTDAAGNAGKAVVNLSSDLSSANASIQSLNKSFTGGTDLYKMTIDAAKEMQGLKLDSFVNELSKISGDGASGAVGQFQSLVDTLKNLRAELDIKAGDGFIGSFDKLNQWQDELKKAQAQIEAFKTSMSGEAFKIDTTNLAELNSLLSNSVIKDAQTSGISALRTELETLRSEYAAISSELASGNVTSQRYTELANELQNLDARFQGATKQAQLFNGEIGNNQKLENARLSLQNIRTQLETLKSGKWADAMQIDTVKNMVAEFEEKLKNADALDLPNLRRGFAELKTNIASTGATMSTFGTEVTNALKQMLGFGSVYMIFSRIRSVIQSMITSVKSINAEMTELKKVTNLTAEEYDKFYANAVKSSKEIGTSVSDMISSTSSFVRLGFSADEAALLAEDANILLRVGAGITTIDEATKYLTSTMQAFGVSAEDALSIVDKIDIAGNTLAIDARGVGEALTRSAASLAAANNSVEESIALISATNRVIQNPEKVGGLAPSITAMWCIVSKCIG